MCQQGVHGCMQRTGAGVPGSFLYRAHWCGMVVQPLHEWLQEQTTLVVVEVVAYGWHSEVAKGACCLRSCVHKQCDMIGAKDDVLRALSQGIHCHLLPFHEGKMQSLGTLHAMYRDDLVINQLETPFASREAVSLSDGAGVVNPWDVHYSREIMYHCTWVMFVAIHVHREHEPRL